MSKLFPLFIVCICLCFVIERRSIYNYQQEQYISKDAIIFVIMSICIISFAGLRTCYNDTETYVQGYEELSVSGLFSGISWKIGDYPFYNILCNGLKLCGFSSQSFIMFFSFFSIGINLWFVRKYSNNIILSIFLFFTMGCFGFNMAAIKQCASMSLCLIAVDRQIQRKTIRCILWVLIATLFHPFAVMFLITPFLEFRPFSNKSLLLIALFAFLGLNFQMWLGNLLDFVSLMGRDYDETLLVGEGVNLFRLAVVWAPILLAATTMKCWTKDPEDRIQNIILNLSMLNAEVMFIAMFGNPVYFGRLSNYFMLFQTISIGYLMKYFDKRSKSFVMMIIIVAYSLYYYYGNVLVGIPFNQAYSAIPLKVYLSNIRG